MPLRPSRRLTPEQIRADYTHLGRLYGVPVYLNEDTGAVCERNGVPEPWFIFVVYLNGAINTGAALVSPGYEPLWPIRIEGRIEAGSVQPER